MTTNVVRVPGNYQISTVAGGVIKLDTGGTALTSQGSVQIDGDLVVYGNTFFGTVTNVTVQNTVVRDNIITLNSGEQSGNVSAAGNIAGILIDRGNNANIGQAATLLFNDSVGNDGFTWHTSDISGRGIWEFKAQAAVSAIRTNVIRIDEGSAPRVGGYPRLNFFGSDNPGAVLSVSGTSNYESRIIDDDDIPNKAYVDIQIRNNQASVDNIRKIKQGADGSESYVEILDDEVTGQPSKVTIGIDAIPRVTVAANNVQFPGLVFADNVITARNVNGTGNNDLYLEPNGNGSITIRRALQITAQPVPPIAGTNTTALYCTGEVGPGGTGIYYVSNATSGEFISRKRAIIYGLIF